MHYLFIFILLLGTVLPGFGQQNRPARILESFEEGVPTGMMVMGGQLSLDTNRMKHGQQALKWDWTGNAQLTFDSPIGYHQQQLLDPGKLDIANSHGGSAKNPILEPPRGFFMWLYNDQARPQRMRFQFGRADLVDCEFDVNLNFKGWRSIAIGYDRGDMRGVPHPDMDRLTIHAPATGSGSFYLDMLGMSITMNPRTVNPNPQLPEIDQHPRLVAQYPHLLQEFSKYTPTLPLKALTEKEIQDFRRIEKQIHDLYWPDFKKAQFTDPTFKKIQKKYAAFGIVRDGEEIYGRPLMNANIMNDYFPELNLPKEKRHQGMMRWRREFNALLQRISDFHYYTDNPAIKAELEEMFINLFDYGIDQGFDTGAGLGWIHHYSYVIREYGPAMFIMREVLQQHGRLEKAHEICRWFYGFNQVYRDDLVYNCEGRIAGNADEIQGILMPKLMTAFLQPDSPEKARDLAHFSRYFSKVYTGYANALDETFKPDGTIFHHAGHAFGYGGRAINGAVSTLYVLSGTVYAAATESYQRLKKVVKTYFGQLFTDRMASPTAFANIRFSPYNLPDQFYQMPALLALSAPEFDEEMAALFDDVLKKYGQEDQAHSFWKTKTDRASKQPLIYDYSGCQVFPYTCVATSRQASDFMITVRGHSKYVYPFESWGKSFFAFPLFVANGFLDVSYPQNLDSPTSEENSWHAGYDWHRWPGVTSVRLPYDEMVTNPGQVRDEGGEYLFSDQAFCGGVSSSYGCGVFAFQFKGHDKFNLQGFTGKKSYFIMGNKVFCLGTDIKSDLPHEVETTLFQTHLANPSIATPSSFKRAISNFPYNQKWDKAEALWMIDSRNTGYYLPSLSPGAELRFSRSQQSHPDRQHAKTVSGNFVSAYINHGISPQNASYQYLLLADATPANMKVFASSMKGQKKPVEVLQQDTEAHVVAFHKEDATAYAVYNPAGAAFEQGLVQAVSKQATFIVQEKGANMLLSVADPDLNIYDGQDDLRPDGTRTELSVYEREWFYWPARATTVRIKLKGKWAIEQQVKEMETAQHKEARIVSGEAGHTIIEFECKDGLSAEVMLVRI